MSFPRDQYSRPTDPDRLAERRRRALEALGVVEPGPQTEPQPTPGVRPADVAAVNRGDTTTEEYYETVRETGVSAANPALGQSYQRIAEAQPGAERDTATQAYMRDRANAEAPDVFARLLERLDPVDRINQHQAMRPGAQVARRDETRTPGLVEGQAPPTRLRVLREIRPEVEDLNDEDIADSLIMAQTGAVPTDFYELQAARNEALASVEELARQKDDQDVSPEALRRRLARYEDETTFTERLGERIGMGIDNTESAHLVRALVTTYDRLDVLRGIRDGSTTTGQLQRGASPEVMRYRGKPDELAAEIDRLEDLIAGDTQALTVNQERSAERPRNPVATAMMQAETTGQVFDRFLMDPLGVMGEIAVPSLVQNLPAMAAGGVAARAVMGAGAAASGGLAAQQGLARLGVSAGQRGAEALTALGATGAAAGTMAAGSGADYYAQSIIETLGKNGVDLTNPEAVTEALGNRELMRQIQTDAQSGALVVGAADGLSVAVGGLHLLPRQVRARMAGQIAELALQANTQGVLGAAGETGGQLARGVELSPGEIFAEYLGEFAQTPGELLAVPSGAREAAAEGGPARTRTARAEPDLQAAVDDLLGRVDQVDASLGEQTTPAADDPHERAWAEAQRHGVPGYMVDGNLRVPGLTRAENGQPMLEVDGEPVPVTVTEHEAAWREEVAAEMEGRTVWVATLPDGSQRVLAVNEASGEVVGEMSDNDNRQDATLEDVLDEIDQGLDAPTDDGQQDELPPELAALERGPEPANPTLDEQEARLRQGFDMPTETVTIQREVVEDPAQNDPAPAETVQPEQGSVPAEEESVPATAQRAPDSDERVQAPEVSADTSSPAAAAATVETAPTSSPVRRVPLGQLYTDPARFQPRDTAYSEESVQRIVEHFDARELDPLRTWTDPKDGKEYILAGHSRHEGLSRLQQAGTVAADFGVPVQPFEGTEAEARGFAARENNSRTAQTPSEDAGAFRTWRNDGTERTNSEVAREAKRRYGKNAATILGLSSLNPTGDAIRMLQAFGQADTAESRDVLTIATWLGQARRRFPQLTDAHERELYQYLLDGYRKRDETRTQAGFVGFVEQVVDRKTQLGEGGTIQFAPGPLNLGNLPGKGKLELEADERVRAADRELAEAQRDRTKAEKDFLGRGATIGPALTKALEPYDLAVRHAQQAALKARQDTAAAREGGRAQVDMFGATEAAPALAPDAATTAPPPSETAPARRETPAAPADPQPPTSGNDAPARAVAAEAQPGTDDRAQPDAEEAGQGSPAEPGAPADELTPEAGQRAALVDQVATALDPLSGISKQDLFSVAENVYGAGRATGAWTAPEVYDALEAAVYRGLASSGVSTSVTADVAARIAERLDSFAKRLPNRSERTADSEAFDQYSTPPALAYLAAWVGAPTAQDVVFEPSAGTGALAMWAMQAGAHVHANELGPNRAALLGLALDGATPGQIDITVENADHAHALFQHRTSPTLVLMNPPFGNTAGRGTKQSGLDLAHIEQAARLLEPGGRLVAIVGDSRDRSRQITADRFSREGLTLRASIGIPNGVFRSSGTGVATRLLVFDRAENSTAPVTVNVDDLGDIPAFLASIRDDRPDVSSRPLSERFQADQGLVPGTDGSREGAGADDGRGARGARPGGLAPGDGGGPARAAAGAADGADATRGGDVVRGADAERSGRATENNTVEPGDGGTPSRAGGPEQGVSEDGGAVAPGSVAPGERTGPAVVVPPGARAVTYERTTVRRDNSVAEAASTSAEGTAEAVYDQYIPSVAVPGARLHPTPLVESAAMAAVSPPPVTYQPVLPAGVVEEGKLSGAQLEAVILAGQAHTQMLPAEERAVRRDRPDGPRETVATRRGFFIGDGTGVGKGREASGIILDNWLQGRTKAVWVSENFKLLEDARRDWEDLSGRNPEEILDWSKMKRETLAEGGGPTEGVAFIGYATLKQKPNARGTGVNRLEQLVSWALTRPDGSTMEPGEFDGVIIFDEAHNMASSMESGAGRSSKKASATALAGLDLQAMLPNARIVYVSATGATEVYNLGYADRLGIWGAERPFRNAIDFVHQVASRGVTAMEQIARDLKAMGLYIARSLSYDGVDYSTLTHELTQEQTEMYDLLARSWQKVLQNMNEALEVTGASKNGTARGNALSQFWGAHQRFFNQIITAIQAPTLIKGIEEALANGESAVIQLVSTNEAATERAAAKQMAESGTIDDLDITPRDQLMQFIEAGFPTAKFEAFLDDNGNTRSRPVLDSKGNPVHDPAAEAMRDQLLNELGSVSVPTGVLDQLLQHFGTDAVAEITGRSRRFVMREVDGSEKMVAENMSRSTRAADRKAFADGKKRILVFSQAGGTGASYHADLRYKNRQRRVHFLAQPGWRADQAVQGFGRSHRSNQAVAPRFVLLTTTLKAQARFMSSIARRLDQLGALTKGQRQASGQGLLGAEHNLETPYSGFALRSFFTDLYRGRVPGLDYATVMTQMGLATPNPNGTVSEQDPPKITQFLNRLLSLESGVMNEVFDAWYHKLDQMMESARLSGDLDVGMETIRAVDAEVVEQTVVYTDKGTGAQTMLVEATLTQRNHVKSWEDVETLREYANGRGAWVGYVENVTSGRVYAVEKAGQMTDTGNGNVTERYRRTGANGIVSYPAAYELADPRRYKPLQQGAAETAWKAEAKAIPETREDPAFLLTGLALPIWDRLPESSKLRRLVVTKGKQAGETMLGMEIHPDRVESLLLSLGHVPKAEQVDINPAELLGRVLDGATVTLAGGWSLAPRRIGGETRAELLGYDYTDLAGLQAIKMIVERVDYKTRIFLPENDTAPEVAAALLRKRPATKITRPRGGSSGYANRGRFNTEGAAASPTPEPEKAPPKSGDGALVPYTVTLPDGTTVAPTMGGTEFVRPVAMPELVYLAEQLMGARPRTARSLRGATGRFQPGEAEGTDGATGVAQIKIVKEVFADPAQATAVIAHEIGHLVDFLGEDGDNTMARGNILGRLRALKKYMRSTVERAAGGVSGGSRGPALDRKDGDRIRRQAQAAIIAREGLTKKAYNESPEIRARLKTQVAAEARQRLDAEIEARLLLSAPKIKRELTDLSFWWRPLQENPSPSYMAYRTSAVELYADALSVLLMAPDELRRRAPAFGEAFFDGLMADKPEVAEAYEEIQLLISGGPEALGIFREGRVREMYDEADARKEQVRAAIEARKKGNLWMHVVNSLVTRWAPVIRRINAVQAAARAGKGKAIAARENPRFLLEEMNMRDGKLAVFVGDVAEQVVAPLSEAGLTTRDLAVYMYLNRVATERFVREAVDSLTDEQREQLVEIAANQPDWLMGSGDPESETYDPTGGLPDDAPDWIRAYLTTDDETTGGRTVLANPRGFTAPTAQETLDHLKARLGDERYGALEAAGRAFSDVAAPHLDEAAELGVYNRTLYEQVIKPNRYSYAAFRVLDFIEHPDYVQAGVKQGTGTLRDVDDVFQATLHKTMSLISENIDQRAKLGVEKMFKEYHPDEWRTPPMVAPGRYARPGADLPGVIRMWENGRKVERHTAQYVARSFEHMNLSTLRWLTTVLRVLNAAYRAGFITYNLTFGLWTNPIRDYRRLLKTANRSGEYFGFRESLKRYVTEAGAAWAYAHGKVTDPRVRHLLSDGAILPPGEAMMFTGRNDGLAQTLARFNLAEVVPSDRNRIMQSLYTLTSPVRWLGARVRHVTRFTEALPKFAADKMLRDRGVETRERAAIVRNRIGTPNVTDGGEWKEVTNNLFMFSNVFTQGWRSDIEAATDPETRVGFWWRTFILDVVPKVAMLAAAQGWIASTLSAALDVDDDDEKENIGAELKSFYDHVPSYDKQNYLIVPLGWSEDPTAPDGRRAVYMRVPHDDSARGAMGALWALLNGKDALTAASSAFDYGAEQVPGISPSIEMMSHWKTFLGGGNPRDGFYDRDIITRQAQTARAAGDSGQAYLEMGASTIDGFGLTRLRDSMRDRGAVANLPFVNRVVKSSAYGLNEEARASEEAEDGRRASVRLQYSRQTQNMNAEYSRLKMKGEDGRSPYEAERYVELSAWQRDAYRLYDELAQEARVLEDEATERAAVQAMNAAATAWSSEMESAWPTR